MPGARPEARGETKIIKRPKPLTSGAGAKETEAKDRSKASPLIPFEDLQPLTTGGRRERRKQCPDCHYCQGCSRDRCRRCRSGRKPTRIKLSQAEQIALFERINRPKRSKPSAPGRR